MALIDGMIHYWTIEEPRGHAKKDWIGTSDWLAPLVGSNNGPGWSYWNRSAVGKINPWSVYIFGMYGGRAVGMNPAIGSSFSWNLWYKYTTSMTNYIWNDNNGANHGFKIYNNTASLTLTWTTPLVAQTITTSGATMSINNWYMVSYVYDIPNNLIKIYVDATERASTAPTGITPRSNGDGGWGWNNNSVNGIVENVGMWNRAITQAEITELYNSGNGLSIRNIQKRRQVGIDINAGSATGNLIDINI
jgi:hypothetical protein